MAVYSLKMIKLPKIDIDSASIRDFLKTDNGILLISMGISLLFWLLIKLSQEYKANREVAITYAMPANMSYISIPPKKVQVTLEGKGWDLMYDYFGGRNSEINFNLASLPSQTITNNQLKGKMVENARSSNVSVIDMSFDYITVELGERASKKVPVILERQLSFAPEHRLQSPIKITPDSIIINGPSELLTDYISWSTTLLALSNLKNTINRPLTLEPNTRTQLTLSTSSVLVNIPVEQFTEKSLFLPVIVKNAPDSLKVFPNKVKTNFVVGLSQYDSISAEDFQLEVDLNGVTINQMNNTAPLLLTKKPIFIKNIRFSPKSVQFLFVKASEQETVIQ